MKPFRFCPACGAALNDPDVEGGAHCFACNRSWYRNPAPTASCAIVRSGRVLVTRRARDPEKGRFDAPGGFLKPGEDPVEGLKREVREELGVEIDVSVEDLIDLATMRYGPEGDWNLNLGFKARLVEGEPVAADDVAEVRWVNEPELDALDFAWEHDRELARRALKEEER